MSFKIDSTNLSFLFDAVLKIDEFIKNSLIMIFQYYQKQYNYMIIQKQW